MPKPEKKGKGASDRLKAATESVVALPAVGPIEPVDIWQIVVVGNIDFRQHHPYWYKYIGCLTDAELVVANKSLTALPNILGQNPPGGLVQFDAGAYSLTVVSDKWMIQTTIESNVGRIVDVVSVVFDKRLDDTGVNAYGINKIWCAKLAGITAKQLLANKLSATDLALPKGNAEANLVYNRHFEDSSTAIHLSPSVFGDGYLLVMYNRHHPIEKQPEGFHRFDLGKLVKENADSDWKSAADYAAELNDCIAREKRD